MPEQQTTGAEAQSETPPAGVQQPVRVIWYDLKSWKHLTPKQWVTLLLFMAFLPFVLHFMNGLTKPSFYTSVCQSVLAHADPFNEVRTNFDYVENGETYRIGDPDKTTGYYTKYNMTAGRGTSEVTCFANVNGTFQYARVYEPEVGQVLGAACYDASGRMTQC